MSCLKQLCRGLEIVEKISTRLLISVKARCAKQSCFTPGQSLLGITVGIQAPLTTKRKIAGRNPALEKPRVNYTYVYQMKL